MIFCSWIVLNTPFIKVSNLSISEAQHSVIPTNQKCMSLIPYKPTVLGCAGQLTVTTPQMKIHTANMKSEGTSNSEKSGGKWKFVFVSFRLISTEFYMIRYDCVFFSCTLSSQDVSCTNSIGTSRSTRMGSSNVSSTIWTKLKTRWVATFQIEFLLCAGIFLFNSIKLEIVASLVSFWINWI